MIDYKTWGAEGIDEKSHAQMRDACALPVARAAALMADAHLGYGVPIGAVLGLEDALCPGAVGVDIGCQVHMTIYGVEAGVINRCFETLRDALRGHTYFGVGANSGGRFDHEVMHEWLWDALPILKEHKENAKLQLGSSGGGNHFAEWGIITVPEDSYLTISGTRVAPAGDYLALLTHGGSRNTGLRVAEHYCKIAKSQHDHGDLSWLDFNSTEGQEYWEAMNLLGRYAYANHWLIHNQITRHIKVDPIYCIDTMHNFAWLEEHGDRTLFVHRKGATPAADGELGIIPGSMGTATYVVSGLGNPDSLCSASHGAGRKLSRSQAKKTLNFEHEWLRLFEEKGITVMGGAADELPDAYKDIELVMNAQADLVRKEARFEPRIVLMAGDKGVV